MPVKKQNNFKLKDPTRIDLAPTYQHP